MNFQKYFIDFLLEGLDSKIQQFIKQFPNLDEKDIRDIAKLDPSPGAKYLNWILLRVKDGDLSFPEDAGKVQETLKDFHRVRNKKDFKEQYSHNIIDYKTFSDLFEAIANYKDDPLKEGTPEAMVKDLKGAEIVYKANPFTIVRVTDPKAAAVLFDDLAWCVKHESTFKQYGSENFLIFKNDKRYALFDVIKPDNRLFNDVHDRPFKDFKEFEPLKPFFKELANQGRVLRPKVLEQLFNEDEVTEMIKKSPKDAYEWAKKMGERLPEAEPYIKQNPDYAYAYARDILQRRFPEAEPTIMTDFETAIKYNRDIRDGERWPDFEKFLIEEEKDISSIYMYIKQFFEKGNRWPEGEKRLLEDPFYTYRYAKTILQGPWPDGESVLKQDPYFWGQYKKKILGEKE